MNLCAKRHKMYENQNLSIKCFLIRGTFTWNLCPLQHPFVQKNVMKILVQTVLKILLQTGLSPIAVTYIGTGWRFAWIFIWTKVSFKQSQKNSFCVIAVVMLLHSCPLKKLVSNSYIFLFRDSIQQFSLLVVYEFWVNSFRSLWNY